MRQLGHRANRRMKRERKLKMKKRPSVVKVMVPAFLILASFFIFGGQALCADYTPDADVMKAVKQYVSTSGNFKKMAGPGKFMVYSFNVEFAYKKYTARVGETKKTGNVTSTVIADGSMSMELDEETYKRITDAMYDSFVNAMSEYTGKQAISKDAMTAEALYQELSGSEKKDTKDSFFSIRRGGNVQTGDKGAETLTIAPTGMKVQGMAAAFQAAKMNELAGKLGADTIMGVTLFVDFDKKSDVFVIKTAGVKISSDMRTREKRIPFKGVVPGEFIYEFFASQDLGLKKDLSAGVKVTDRRTGFFEQVSGTYHIDTNAAAKSILEAYNTVAFLQAVAVADKMK